MDSRGSTPAAPANDTAGITLFRTADAGPLEESQMPMEGMDQSVAEGFAKVMEAGAAEDTGADVRCLFREPHAGGLSLCYAWFKSGYLLPRHSHDADCVYYVIGGELRLGNQVLRKGDGFFVPSGAPYSYRAGPEGVEVLEFRNATQFNIAFKGNDARQWERIAQAYRDNLPQWKGETVPPSDRTPSARDAVAAAVSADQPA
jgi:quercetin dioxygenase-like cupin family protein